MFTFNRLDATLAPKALLLWTRTQVKLVADIYKTLFHTLRDRSKNSFDLEKNILLAAYRICAEAGANSASIEALYQIGSKLASMHFAMTDRFYGVCVNVVKFGVEFATTVDPTMLQAVTPYCCKLRPSDALAIVNGLTSNDIFSSPTNPYARAFVVALRRAAKLEDPAAPAATPSRSSKRPRELTTAPDEEDGILAEVVRTQRKAKGKDSHSSATPVRHQSVNGWRVRDNVTADALDPPKTGRLAKVQEPARHGAAGTQESTISDMMNALDSDEVFIATQEYE
jgi:cohesin complex subunit SA-1/2